MGVVAVAGIGVDGVERTIGELLDELQALGVRYRLARLRPIRARDWQLRETATIAVFASELIVACGRPRRQCRADQPQQANARLL
jgi:hypothetical protein